MIEILKIIALITAVQKFFTLDAGKRISRFLPAPFWIYFLPMILSAAGVLNPQDPVYGFIAKHIFPMALFMMLIGTPVFALFRLGGKAALAMALGTLSIFIGTMVSFAALSPFFDDQAYKCAGALLATWTGGSANMLVVKETLSIPDSSMATLVVTDTFLSYTWMALLVAGVNFQHKFPLPENIFPKSETANISKKPSLIHIFLLFLIAIAVSEMIILLGVQADLHIGAFNARAWTLLIMSTVTVLLALTPMKKLESFGAGSWGAFLLYMVLAGIGAKTSLADALSQAPLYFLFGIILFLIHGILMLVLGKLLKIPLFLLATASQANIGGPVSAPIVAGLYQPGTAQYGVLMGIAGNLVGTYVGLFGAWVCHHLKI